MSHSITTVNGIPAITPDDLAAGSPAKAIQDALQTLAQKAALLPSNNLSDLTDGATARTNLGLSTVAATGAYSDLSGTSSVTTQGNTFNGASQLAKLSSLGDLSYAGNLLLKTTLNAPTANIGYQDNGSGWTGNGFTFYNTGSHQPSLVVNSDQFCFGFRDNGHILLTLDASGTSSAAVLGTDIIQCASVHTGNIYINGTLFDPEAGLSLDANGSLSLTTGAGDGDGGGTFHYSDTEGNIATLGCTNANGALFVGTASNQWNNAYFALYSDPTQTAYSAFACQNGIAQISATNGISLGSLPTSDPANGQSILWMDSVTRQVYVGT